MYVYIRIYIRVCLCVCAYTRARVCACMRVIYLFSTQHHFFDFNIDRKNSQILVKMISYTKYQTGILICKYKYNVIFINVNFVNILKTPYINDNERFIIRDQFGKHSFISY